MRVGPIGGLPLFAVVALLRQACWRCFASNFDIFQSLSSPSSSIYSTLDNNSAAAA